MNRELPTIKIDLDRECPACGQPGAVMSDAGFPTRCLDCVTLAVKTGEKNATKYLPYFWTTGEPIETMAARLVDEHHHEAAAQGVGIAGGIQ